MRLKLVLAISLAFILLTLAGPVSGSAGAAANVAPSVSSQEPPSSGQLLPAR